jgi:hypothetical protein
MRAISGQLFADSSPSADLQLSLASRLRARMAETGSLEYSLIWSEWRIDGQEPICALLASARRTFGSDCIGWPTPDTDHSAPSMATRLRGGRQASLPAAAQGWMTPRANDAHGSKYHYQGGNHSKPVLTLAGQASGWSTPTSRDGKGRDLPSRHGAASLPTQALGWATPKATDGEKSTGMSQQRMATRAISDNLVSQAHGTTSNTSHAENSTAVSSPGALNPALPLWLMGFPSDWLMVAPGRIRRSRASSPASGTRSTPTLRRNSFERIAKAKASNT